MTHHRRGLRCLLKDDDLITRSLTQKLLIYASGRPFTLADRPSLNQVLQKNQKNPGLRTLIHMITQTDMFLRR